MLSALETVGLAPTLLLATLVLAFWCRVHGRYLRPKWPQRRRLNQPSYLNGSSNNTKGNGSCSGGGGSGGGWVPRRAVNAGAFCAAPLADRSSNSSGGTSVDGRSGVDDLLSGGGRGSPDADEDSGAVLVPMASEHMIGRDDATTSSDVTNSHLGPDASENHNDAASNSSGSGIKRRPSSAGNATEGRSNHEDRAAAALAAARAAVWTEKLPNMSEESTIMDEGQVRDDHSIRWRFSC